MSVFSVRSVLAMTVAFVLIPLGALAVSSAARASTRASDDAPAAREVYWSDGDSGRLRDGTRFRLHGVDAPETGGIGARGGAFCEDERALGYVAKAAAVELTRDQFVRVARDYGLDRYDRHVVDLEVGGFDVGMTLMAGGTHKVWKYDDGAKKPDWCGASRAPPAS